MMQSFVEFRACVSTWLPTCTINCICVSSEDIFNLMSGNMSELYTFNEKMLQEGKFEGKEI